VQVSRHTTAKSACADWFIGDEGRLCHEEKRFPIAVDFSRIGASLARIFDARNFIEQKKRRVNMQLDADGCLPGEV
jgi:hypothetical protein